jgi:hypothetical protein
MKSINNNNAYNTYVNNTVISRRKPQLTVIEGTKQESGYVSPADRVMTLKEKILMNILVWGGLEVVVYLFATGDWWQ